MAPAAASSPCYARTAQTAKSTTVATAAGRDAPARVVGGARLSWRLSRRRQGPRGRTRSVKLGDRPMALAARRMARHNHEFTLRLKITLEQMRVATSRRAAAA